MKFKPSYIIGIFMFILSVFFFNAYLQNHTYYFTMMQNVKHLYEILAGFICAGVFVYVLLNLRKNILFLLGLFISLFLLFSIILTALRGGLISLPIIVVNYLIVLFYVFVIFLGALALGNMIIKKLNFKESIYNFSIKFGLGFAVLSLITYFLTIFGFINVYISYLLFFALFFLIYKNKDFIKELFSNLSYDLNDFIENISENVVIKPLFAFIFFVICLYFYFGFNYSFIAYPTAWDASHAYIYYPMVFSNYNGYPWSTDFRPGIILWSTVLTWIGQLGTWTWFSKDTWMITFNYFSGILTIVFGFMLINILVKFVYKKKDFKHNLLLILGYILLLTWLSSGMGAFLLFVDNKTDIAALMYIILGIFLAIYFLERLKEYFEEIKNIEETEYGVQKEKNDGKMKLLYVFIALSGFFFAIANLIKPTATFDFFETTIVLSVLNIGIFIVIGIILFVVGLLSYLKFRGFDKAVDPKYSMSLIGGGVVAIIFDIILNLLKKAKRFVFIFVVLLVFVGTFLLTLIVTKGTFGLLQAYYDKNIDKNVIKIVTSIVMGNSFPTIAKNEFTGSLYSGLKKEIGSSYNEDNGRYVGYGEHNFHQVWWDIFIPSNITYKHCLKKNDYNQCVESETKKLKSTYCVKLTPNVKEKCKVNDLKNYKNKDFVQKEYTRIYASVLREKAWEFFENRDKDYINKYVLDIISKYGLDELSKKFGINKNKIPKYKLKSMIYDKIKKNYEDLLLNEIKDKFMKGKIFNLSNYDKALQTEKNKKLLEQLNTKNVYYTEVSVPYTRLVPFNVTFNWSLQNHSSYYTDIGIMWLVLFILVIFAFVYSILLFVYALIKKDDEKIQDSKLIFAFSFATLVGWIIWNFVASGIVWYNIGGIIWLIITTLVYVSKLKDRNILIYVLIGFSILNIGLNFIRISNQGGGKYLFYYKNSAGKIDDYKLATDFDKNYETNEKGEKVIKSVTIFDDNNRFVVPLSDIVFYTPQVLVYKTYKLKIPYNKQDLFTLGFGLYNRIIKFLDKREKGEKVVIGGTYMKYFLKNQDGIIDDQFLTYLWKLGSDENINKFYERLKDKKIKYIVLDPNIAGVVQGKGNIEIWYRYFGKVDKEGNLIEKGVLPHLVDLANEGKLEYKFSTNLAKKYALIYTDGQMGKILGIKDLKKVREIKYEMIALPHIKRDLAFINKNLAEKLTQRAYAAYINILKYRFKKAVKSGYYVDIASDIADVFALNVENVQKVLENKEFDNLNPEEKLLKALLNRFLSEPELLIGKGINAHVRVLFVEIK